MPRLERLNSWKIYTKLGGLGVHLMSRMDASAQKRVHWCREVYEAHAAGLLLYGRALGLSHAEAEDMIQETFLSVLKLEAPPSNAHHYIVRAFRNRSLNARRGLFRRLARELESRSWFESHSDQSPRELEAMETLANLPPDQKEVIVLKVWHRLTFEEIGELLDVSPNTAAGRYRYGLQKLRDQLSKTSYEPELRRPFGESIKVLETA